MSIVNEPFLVNPPKRRRKHKSLAGLGGAHRPLVFGPKSGPWRRSHGSRSKKHRVHLQNPFGGELMIAGANPKRRRHAKRRRHNAHRRMRRHYRSNPALALGNFGRITGLNQITGNIGNILVGGAALIATPVLANMTGLAGGAPWRKYGMQTVIVLGGGFVLGMFGPSKRYSGAWVIGGAAGIAAELLRQYVIPMIPGMSAFRGYDNYTPGYPAFGPGYVPLESLSGFDGLGYEQLGAFPGADFRGDGLGAFPDEAGAVTPFIPGEGTSVY